MIKAHGFSLFEVLIALLLSSSAFVLFQQQWQSHHSFNHFLSPFLLQDEQDNYREYLKYIPANQFTPLSIQSLN